MKFIESFKLALKNVKTNSLRRNVFIIIIMLFSIIVSIPFFIYELALFYEGVTREMSEFKTVVIESNGLTDENIIFLKEYDNENIVKKDFAAIHIYGHINSDLGVAVMEIIDKHTPELVKGRYPQKEGEMLCPSKMPIERRVEEISDLKDTKINDSINFNIVNSVSYEEFNHSFKIVGTYDADYTLSYSACYVATKDYEKLYNEIVTSESSKQIKFYIDTAEHAYEIEDDLESKGMRAFVPTLDLSFLPALFSMGTLLMVVVSMLGLIVLIVYIFSYYKSQVKRVALYKAVGYDKKEINRIIFLEIIIQIIIASIAAVIFVEIAGIGIEKYAHQFVDYRLLDVKIPILPFISYYIITIFLGYISVKYNGHKMNKLTIRELLED